MCGSQAVTGLENACDFRLRLQPSTTITTLNSDHTGLMQGSCNNNRAIGKPAWRSVCRQPHTSVNDKAITSATKTNTKVVYLCKTGHHWRTFKAVPPRLKKSKRLRKGQGGAPTLWEYCLLVQICQALSSHNQSSLINGCVFQQQQLLLVVLLLWLSKCYHFQQPKQQLLQPPTITAQIQTQPAVGTWMCVHS